MSTIPSKNLVAVSDFCQHHNIEISFVQTLQETGLIEVTIVQENGFINVDQLHQLEKIVRFYYDLDINIEGIETINHMLLRINTMQDEIMGLRNRLGIYENDI